MERTTRKTDRIILRTIIASLMVGLVSSTMISPYRQAAYAHTFTGDESASFMSLIKLLQAEENLVQTNLANKTLAQDHAKAIVDEINGNHTFGVLPDEVSENNKRVAADVVRSGEALQTAVKSASSSPTDVTAKLSNLNSTLQEAVAVRLPQDAPKNFTINLISTKDLVNETLRQYGYSYGVASQSENNSSANPSSTNIVNMSAYQTAKSLTSQAQDMFTQAKSLVPSNATSTTRTAMTTVASDLTHLKNLVDAKTPYEKVATLIQKTVYPDIDKVLGMK